MSVRSTPNFASRLASDFQKMEVGIMNKETLNSKISNNKTLEKKALDNENPEYKEYKSERILELFFRALKGEALSAQALAYEYHISTRSVTRDINDLKNFLAEHRHVLGNAELRYSSATHSYTLSMDNLLSNKELFAITKVLLGSRAFSKDELLKIISKLKTHTSYADRNRLETLITNELRHYNEINYDCKSIIENVWDITTYIMDKRMISINYYKMNRTMVKHKLIPVSIMFSEYYFYLIAYKYGDTSNTPIYFRIDRITHITAHRENFVLNKEQLFDEGLLRSRSQFMWPGPLRKIRFEFTGPSLQAILDRIPTAKLIDIRDDVNVVEAEVYGDGIKMFLLSQGSWVKVTEPIEFVYEMRQEIEKMQKLY